MVNDLAMAGYDPDKGQILPSNAEYERSSPSRSTLGVEQSKPKARQQVEPFLFGYPQLRNFLPELK